MTGLWPIGERIPTETELAQLTNTSRNTVREAVQALVHAGLLERRQGSGTYVLAASELAGAVGRQVASARTRHVLEMRRVLEVGAARLAARHRDAGQVAEMRALIVERNEAVRAGELNDAADADVRLHLAIVRASGNPLLVELYENVAVAMDESVRVFMGQVGLIEEVHLDLVEAIAAGDTEAAGVEAACFLDDLLAAQP